MSEPQSHRSPETRDASAGEVIVLLPPSETKRAGGDGQPLDLTALSAAAELHDARRSVLDWLTELVEDRERAAAVLSLTPRQATALDANARLATAPTLPALSRYTGVLYDAIDADTLAPEAIAWAHQHVAVQSALWGLISAGDRIPDYRLSAGVRKSAFDLIDAWEAPERSLLNSWVDDGHVVLDLRSKAYARLGPLPVASNARWVEVTEETGSGTGRALNHFNKRAKGLLVRALAELSADHGSVKQPTSGTKHQGGGAKHPGWEVVEAAADRIAARFIMGESTAELRLRERV